MNTNIYNIAKKIIGTLLCVITLQLSVYAGWNRSMLRVRDSEGRRISISIDGRKFNKTGTKLTIGDLPAGRHMIKVYVMRQGYEGRNGNRYGNGNGNSNGRLIYQGTILTKPGKIYFCTVDDYEDMNVEVHCCIDNSNYNNFNTWNDDQWDTNGYGWGGNNWHNNDSHNNNNNDNDDYDNDNYGNHNNNNHNNNDNDNNNWNNDNQQNGWNNYNGIMSNQRFDQLIDQVRKASFENSKTSVIKQTIKYNKINCQQLLRLMNEYSFETTKLQLAKDLYNSVVDKKNYYIINDAFTFQSSKDDLADFINQH